MFLVSLLGFWYNITVYQSSFLYSEGEPYFVHTMPQKKLL